MLHMVSLMCQKMARELLLNWECHSENITRYWVICGNVTNVPFKLTWVTLQKKKVTPPCQKLNMKWFLIPMRFNPYPANVENMVSS